jgi:hypothetical protein
MLVSSIFDILYVYAAKLLFWSLCVLSFALATLHVLKEEPWKVVDRKSGLCTFREFLIRLAGRMSIPHSGAV